MNNSEKDTFGTRLFLVILEKGVLAALAVVAYGLYQDATSAKQRESDERRATQELQLLEARLQLEYLPKLRNPQGRIDELSDLLAAAVYNHSLTPEIAIDLIATYMSRATAQGGLDAHKAEQLAERAVSGNLESVWPMARILANRWHWELAPFKPQMRLVDANSYDAMERDWGRNRAVFGGAASRCLVRGNAGLQFAAQIASPPSASPLAEWYVLFGAPAGLAPAIQHFEMLQDARIDSLSKLGWRGKIIDAIDQIRAMDQEKARGALLDGVQGWSIEERGLLAREVIDILGAYCGANPPADSIRALEGL